MTLWAGLAPPIHSKVMDALVEVGTGSKRQRDRHAEDFRGAGGGVFSIWYGWPLFK